MIRLWGGCGTMLPIATETGMRRVVRCEGVGMKSGFPSAMPARLAAIVLAGMVGLAGPVAARTLAAGPEREWKEASGAPGVAEDGDPVLIDPGAYFDCLSIQRNHLTIAGAGPGVVLTDRTCE